jgi:ABC-2 type transport system permease protein
LVLATIAFAGIGMLMAGSLRAEMTLAVANGLYIVLLLLGGMIIPLSELPSGLETFAKLLPAAALSQVVGAALDGGGAPTGPWAVLAVWAVAAPLLAAWRFRWE